MISIYTRTNNPLTKEFWKWLIKKVSGKYSGPDAVLDSLKRGLSESNIPFEINPLKPKYKIVHVISGIEALKKAIKTKKIDQTLLVGPNLVISPLDYGGILMNKKINKIILPSDWTAEVYSTISPEIKDKIYIWPAGTSCNVKYDKKEKRKCLIYKKNTEKKLYQDIIKCLVKKNIPYDIIEYGKHNQKDYFDKLLQSKFLIYLQISESQGLAIQEAWAHNIPTFVWNKGYIISEGIKFEGKISAPYLTNETGEFFKDFNEFESKLSNFIIRLDQLRPAEYCKNNLSIKTSTRTYMNIIKDKAKPWWKK